MAGVLEQLIRPQKSVVVHCNPKALELQMAKEILAEVFSVRISEVDEMIQNRFEKVPSKGTCCEEDGLWPQEFWLEGPTVRWALGELEPHGREGRQFHRPLP